MQRSNRAAWAAILVAGLAVAMPVAAAQPAASPRAAMPLAGECELPDSTREAYAARQARGEVTRAQVRAQVEVWRASGMAQLSRARPLPDVYSERYRQHYAAYVQMRNGPAYAQALCQELGNE
ncbi:hypothetical protein [Achromobacter xylosoxidans]|uniref:hypothetical protein n=1 Tax=Alcaligenes xylosoxydans xylosoxydans TaxID=85698 RepID=UPI0006BFC609|nr:hypothetical protein [Achromobacter xylosoxidans]CUI31346.1 Uncharacterised protein [Achromobacter xylosoxidans]